MSETVKLIDEQMIRRAVATLVPAGHVFEVRIIGKRGKAKPISGYFTDAETLIKAMGTVDLRNVNVYITLQAVSEDCYSRSQHDCFMAGATSTTDSDIEAYNWLFVDLDPVRKAEISSTAEELDEATALAKRVYDYLKCLGFEEPLVAFSGNGLHLLYNIGLENTEENADLIHRCLMALDMQFSTDGVKIDTVNYNASRICKLYGTLAQKGANTPKRPHRMSQIIGKDREYAQTKKVYLEELASAVQIEKVKPERYNNYNPSAFDVGAWLDKHGMRYTEKSFPDGGRKFVLDECPFNPEHTAPDSMIIQQTGGQIGFKCLHNSCRGMTWNDLWRKIDPQTYSTVSAEADKRIEEGWKQHNASRTDIKYADAVPGESTEPVWYTAEMIANKPKKNRTFIKTGCNELDYKMYGLEKGCLSLLSGLRGGGKSTLLNGWMLNAIEYGHTVVCYSGELSEEAFMRWMNLSAAGKANVVPVTQYDNMYEVTQSVELEISRWIGNKLWLYNNNYGHRYEQVMKWVREKVEETKADLVIIDNIMSMDLSELDRDKYEAQTRFMWSLKHLARQTNAHVLFVAHPRKAAGFLRLDDVSGSANIGNIVDNAFIVHRNNDDFKNRTKADFKRPDDWVGYQGTNAIEICKNREGGAMDYFIPLFYETETKRLKNYASENVVYGWDHSNIPDGFTSVNEEVPW